MKKLVALMSAKGKTKEQFTDEVVGQLKEKGFFKEEKAQKLKKS